MSIIAYDTGGTLREIYIDADGLVNTRPVTGGAPGAGGVTYVSTYVVSNALTLASKLASGVPLTGVDTFICDMVSSVIYKAYPWRDTLAVFPDGMYPLVDGQQDYALQTIQIMRPTQFSIVRLDVSPIQVRELDVAKNLTVDMVPRSPWEIRSAAVQAGVQKLRLESAVHIPAGARYELRGEYQPHPNKITTPTQALWFADECIDAFAKGLAYWALRIADKERAGNAVKVGNRVQYTGQLAEFMDAIDVMAAAEDFGNTDGYYPSESFAADGRRYGVWPLGY